MSGFLESFLIGTATSLANVAIDTVKEGGGGLFSRVSQRISEDIRQKYFEASKKYIENYATRHCKIKVLGMREPIDLDSIYTSVNFLDSLDILRFDSVESLEEVYRSDRLGGFSPKSKKKDRKPGITVVNRQQYLMVLGGPGIGKSTFLRKVGLEAIKGRSGNYKHQKIPVFIELKRLDSKDVDIQRIIANEFDVCGFPSAQNFSKRALDKGRLLVILDGIDEVPVENLNLVLTKIQDFVDRYKDNNYIASCRTAAYKSKLRHFTDVELANFDDSQILQFIKNWFKSAIDISMSTAENCWKTLTQPENASAKELAHTPLLLTFLCLVFDHSQSFPNNRSALYRKAMRILLEEWAAEKRIMREAIYEGLSVELETILLSEIAFQGFHSDKLFFTRKEISSQIKTFLENNLNAPKYLDGESVLKAIEVQQGIIVERAEDTYSFSHLTLQEYLTAQYVIENRLVDDLIENDLFSKRWREVFLLISGLMRGRTGADELLYMIYRKAVDRIRENPFILVLQEVIKIDEFPLCYSESDYSLPDSSDDHDIEINSLYSRLNIAYLIFSTGHDVNIIESGFYGDMEDQKPFNLTNDYQMIRENLFKLAQEMKMVFSWDKSYVSVRGLPNVLDLYEQRINSLHKANLISREVKAELHFLIRDLRKSVPNNAAPVEMRIQFLKNVVHSFAGKLGIKLDTMNFSSEDLSGIIDYLYACDLLISCKNAAVLVSPKIWERIEELFLTPIPLNLIDE